jgi:uncharacterized protein YcbX
LNVEKLIYFKQLEQLNRVSPDAGCSREFGMMNPANIRIVSLYRYPVKGLSAQKLDHAVLEAEKTIAWDRAYAIENGPGRFDPDNPRYLPKVNFLMLMRNERLAALETHFDEDTQILSINRDGKKITRGALNTKLGRQMIEQFLASYMQGELKGRPRIVSSPDHSFSDVSAKCLHLVNLATIAELEKASGQSLNPLRFRANLYFEGTQAWSEKKWVGQTIRAGTAKLKVFDETVRCEATNVNPKTAQRDAAIPPTLARVFGDMCLGVYAKVIEGGEIRTGDKIES